MSGNKLVSKFFFLMDVLNLLHIPLFKNPSWYHNYPIKIIMNSTRIAKFYYSIIINPIQSTFSQMMKFFFQGLVNDKKQLKTFYLLAAIHFSPRDCFFSCFLFLLMNRKTNLRKTTWFINKLIS